jgi:hypothetical protein
MQKRINRRLPELRSRALKNNEILVGLLTGKAPGGGSESDIK